MTLSYDVVVVFMEQGTNPLTDELEMTIFDRKTPLVTT